MSNPQLQAIVTELHQREREGRLAIEDWARLYVETIEVAPGRDTEFLMNFCDPAWEAKLPAAIRQARKNRLAKAAE